MSGKLCVVGVGPGDPELVTLKAVAALRAAEVVAYPETTRGSLAARIASAHIAGARPLPFPVPMTGEGAAETAYDDAATKIEAALSEGRTVALLCEGDPMLYGSAGSLIERIGARWPVEIVAGVTGFSAAAAGAGLTLGRGEEPVTILPATAGRPALRAALARQGALAIYKVGRRFDEVRAAIIAAGRGDGAVLAVRATWPEAELVALSEAQCGAKPYFSTVLVPAGAERAVPRTNACAVIALSPAALDVARRAKAATLEAGHAAAIHGLAHRIGADEADLIFADTMMHLGALYARGCAIVGVLSSAILIRAVGPLLRDKHSEPPVVALAEDASAVVPLLGAHRGGAKLAALLGEALGVRPATTTASETRLGMALDDPPEGFRVADPAPFKALAGTLRTGGANPDPSLAFLPPIAKGPTPIRATIAPTEDAAEVPTYIVRRVAFGMGAERGADPDAAVSFARRVLREANVDPRAVALVATLDKKADEPALHAVAKALDAPLRVFPAARLAEEEHRLAHPSETVRAAVGVAGVAEAAALAAVGASGELLRVKQVEGRLTAALGVAPRPIDPAVGRARGHLAIVGIGPGGPAWRTAQCVARLAEADAFVGYSLYLDLVEDVRGRQARHDFALGAEAERVRFALEQAGEGRSVALISSGDAGIYAMASLAMELLDGGDICEGARRVAVEVVPGITAAQAAAASAGAPLGHDFACISLSDLLTPWAIIEARLKAAARADFAVALYNPRSRRRTEGLRRAKAIFTAHRAPTTPVIVASNLGRPGNTTHHTTLDVFDPEGVDMLTTVVIGATTTRTFVRGDGRPLTYTPRGYAV